MKVMWIIVASCVASCAVLALRASRAEPDLVWRLELSGRYKRYQGYHSTVAKNPTARKRWLGVSVPHPSCEDQKMPVRITNHEQQTVFDGLVGCRPVEVSVPPHQFVTVSFSGLAGYELSLWLR